MLVLRSHLGEDPGFGYVRKTTRTISDWATNQLTACLIGFMVDEKKTEKRNILISPTNLTS